MVFMEQAKNDCHPSLEWKQDSRQPGQDPGTQLRLAAMAGHMRVDRIAARRAALIDLLADGRVHTREEIWEVVAARVGENCWGKLPREALARDLSTLRAGGIRIAYSRRPETTGYYLQQPWIERPSQTFEEINWNLVGQLRRLPTVEKNMRAFAAADFALRQKRLVLAEDHPEWPAELIELEARQLVYGVTPDML